MIRAILIAVSSLPLPGAACCGRIPGYTFANRNRAGQIPPEGSVGHLYKLARASGVTAVIDAAAVPYLDGAREAAVAGYISGGTRRILDWVAPHTRFAGSLSETEWLLLAGAQTSGGLLVAGEIPGAPLIGELIPRGTHVLDVR